MTLTANPIRPCDDEAGSVLPDGVAKPVACPGDGSTPTRRTYTVGTLRYTTRGLVVLFAWLLWGDFCFSLFENLFGRFMPLYLKQLHADNFVIGLLTGGLAGGVSVLFLPNISMWTDRYRSRWGRRIPFLFWTTPCLALSMILIGYAPEISQWLGHTVGPLRVVSFATLTIALVWIFTVSWQFFNMMLVNLFRFLTRDVVPLEVIPRFQSYFQVVAVASSMLFSYYIYPHVLDQRQWVCTGVGLTYLGAFMLMCWRVKEGQYPPPGPPSEKSVLAAYFKNYYPYFRECLSVSLYRNVLMFTVVLAFAGSTGPFQLLFLKYTIHVSLADQGRVFTWTAPEAALFTIFGGYLCTKFNAVRVYLVGLIVTTIATLVFMVVVRGLESWCILTVINTIPLSISGVAYITLFLQIFPSEKFGQFFSTLGVVGWGSALIAYPLAGWCMDYVHGHYRQAYLVTVVFDALAIVPMVQVYRGWKRHGGPHHYVPPLPAT